MGFYFINKIILKILLNLSLINYKLKNQIDLVWKLCKLIYWSWNKYIKLLINLKVNKFNPLNFKIFN